MKNKLTKRSQLPKGNSHLFFFAMTQFLGDAIGSRDGKGKIDRKRDLEEFRRTGRHPEIEAAREAAASAAATAAPLPARDPDRRHVYLDLTLPSSTTAPSSSKALELVRLVVEVFDDVDRAAGGALLARCCDGGGGGSSFGSASGGLLSGGGGGGGGSSLAGARLSRAQAGQGLFFAAPRDSFATAAVEPFSSARNSSGPALLHHTEAGAVSLSRAALSGGGNGSAGSSGASSSDPLLAVLFQPCGPLDSNYAVAGRVVPQCLPSLEKLERMAREDSEKTARNRRLTLLSCVEVAAAGRATPKQASSLTSTELDAEASRDAAGRREAARVAASPAAAAARADAEAAAARGAVEEALAVATAEAEARRELEQGGEGEGKKGGLAAAQAAKKRRKKKKGGMLDTVLARGDEGDDDSDSDSDSSEGE